VLAQEAQAARISCEYWWNLSAVPFETNCAQLLRSRGFGAVLTARTNDGNIDIMLEKDGTRGAAQCKAWNQPCGVKIVREFIGTVYSADMKFGYLIAKSGFTPSAKALLEKTKLIEGWDIGNLVQYAAAVRSEN